MKAAIIIPYRNRDFHLKQFIPTVLNYTKAMGVDCEIVIIEQAGHDLFNRGKLLNVGFDMFKNKVDYFIFHDVDMLPVQADYSYVETPTHIATRCSQFKNKMPYPDYFGGVTIFNRANFEAVNGFNNNFWGWGAEDDDLRNRVVAKGLHINRKSCSFKSLDHRRELNSQAYNANVKLLRDGVNFEDGLTSLKYELIDSQIVYGQMKYICELKPQAS